MLTYWLELKQVQSLIEIYKCFSQMASNLPKEPADNSHSILSSVRVV